MDCKGIEGSRHSAEEMDEIRQKQVAYEYLCRLEEAKKWLEAVLKEELPSTTELEENLRNGVYLARLGNLVAPLEIPQSKIYDIDQKRYENIGLQFRYTDNINYWIKSLHTVELPITFHPETTDVYDKKNMPRVIYCIHALSSHLFKQGKAPQIQDLFGKVTFSDKEISAMSSELRKYGLQLPAFHKIGSLLTGSIEGNGAALHAVIIAINKAITDHDNGELLKCLTNANSRLFDILPEYILHYSSELDIAKAVKVDAAINRSLSDSYEPDVYDELLTQMEIQGHITAVNVKQKWVELWEAAEKKNVHALAEILNSPCLQLRNVQGTHFEKYAEEVKNLDKTIDGADVRAVLQHVINDVNLRVKEQGKCEKAVAKVNYELDAGNVSSFLSALRNPCLGLDPQLLTEFAAPLYFEEMQADRQECQSDLNHQDIIASVKILHQIAAVSCAIDTGSVDNTWTKMLNLKCINGLEPGLKLQYWQALASCRQYKGIEHCNCSVLTYMNIQDSIDVVNSQNDENNKVIECLHDLNQAVRNRDMAKMLNILKDPVLKLQLPNRIDSNLLFLLFLKKQHEQTERVELWLEDVNTVVGEVIKEVDEVQQAMHWLSELNVALQRGSSQKISSLLNSFPQYNNKLHDQCYVILRKCKRYKESKYTSSWVSHETSSKTIAYINLDTFQYSWDRPQDHRRGSYYLSKKDIEKMLTKLEKSNARVSQLDVEKCITGLQARCRGFIVRKLLADRLQYFRKHDKQLRVIQKWWKSILLKRTQQQPVRDLKYYRLHEAKIVKIQALWRGHKTRRDILSFFQHPNPSFKVVRLFLPLLAFSTEDYHRELELQELKEQVVQTIRRNNLLSQQIDKMDIIIGLLVQNRITLQDVLIEGKNMDAAVKSTGLTALRAESHRQLKAYQHLFYTLQTQPHYLAKLIFSLPKPQNRTNRFLDAVIFSIFHFGAHQREEYLLLKLFQHALHEEIRCKFAKPLDVMCGEPLVLKMAVYYARKQSGQNPLRYILGPLIQQVLNDKNIFIDTNPVSLFYFYRNQIETTTGKPSNLPTSVTMEEALSHEEVRKKLNASIATLKSTTNLFLDRIIQCKNNLPFGLRFVAKELRSALKYKFPDAPDKEILKVVGNLIYYRYINAAIVAPDSFDIVTLTADQTLSSFQREVLASIAKILQFAAAKKGFGDESKHLLCLNPFLIECHEKLKTFFHNCCDVEDIDKHFNMTEFSEAALISKPSITISLQEICNTHSLLQEYVPLIAPDPMDPLNELLNDLGPVPTVHQLLGYGDEEELAQRNIGQTEVRLTLVNKFEVPSDMSIDLTNLFIKTKELVVNVLPFLSGHNLPGSLRIEPTPQQEAAFERKCASKLQDQPFTLREYKAKLRKHLSKLEEAGVVNREDGYQSIITSIAQDIGNRGKYRHIQAQELQAVRSSKQCLTEKTKFYEEQVHFYNQYIQKCLENLNAGKKKVHSLKKQDKVQKVKAKYCVKHSAAKLQEKGILLSIDGLPETQFKNVQFEISPTDHDGVFTVKGKFMGVEIEKVDIDIQKLLQLQFEGVSVMDIFGKAKVNINLLLFLLNKKFYGKT